MTDYMKASVAIYKKSEKGFYRLMALRLDQALSRSPEDENIKRYRASKTADAPKGNRDLKNKIMAYMPAGDYGRDKPRKVGNPLASETGLVQLDFDVEVKPKRIKDLFKKYPFIAVAQTSCGGKGFYLLINTPGSEFYAEYFAALCKFFQAEEKLTVDQAVSSVNEIRFMSLTSECMIRKDAQEWTERERVVKSKIDNLEISVNGKAIELDETWEDLHYNDVVSYAGKSNANGTPLELAIKSFPIDKLDPASHLKKKSLDSTLEAVGAVIKTIYERYVEQHGEAAVASMALVKHQDIDLPKIKFSTTETPSIKAIKIVKTILQKYSLKTDYKTRTCYRFNAKYWEQIESHDLRNFLSQCAVATGYNADKAEVTSFRDLMEEQIMDLTNCSFEIPGTQFNLNNGVITFIDGDVILEEHNDAYPFTYCLDYDYDPGNVNEKEYRKFIDRIIPDPDTQSVFWEYVAACFLPEHIKFEKTLILLGTGANGKSTLIDLLRDLFGSAVGNFSLEGVTDTAKSAQAMQGIYNKLIGVCTEGRQVKDMNLWRMLISKEPVDIRYLYKDQFTTSNYGRMITCMNEMTNIEAVKGTMRRLIIIGMNAIIQPEEMDARLRGKLKAERTAILQHMIEGYRRVFRNEGITLSREVVEFTKEVVDEQDPVLSWVKTKRMFPIDQKVITFPGKKMSERLANYMRKLKIKGEAKTETLEVLYKSYVDWCEDEGIRFVINKRKLATRLRAIDGKRLGFESKAVFFTYKERVPLWVFGVGPENNFEEASDRPEAGAKDAPF